MEEQLNEQHMRLRIAASVAATELVVDKLNDSGFAGLQWSPKMPDDDPDAPTLVIAEDGMEYELEVEVYLHSYPG